MRNPVVVIPSLEPDGRLPQYVAELMRSGFSRVVVVDDGSGPDYKPIFDEIAALGATTLGYAVNQGKGMALKTGYRWVLENEPDCVGVLTADADGQHTVPDCLKLAQALREEGDALYLGSRDFSLPNVPPKSRSGNRITSAVFKALYGVWLPDTQTGLRAFRREELQFMIDVPGARYEYEMNVLIACARRKLPMKAITIETVYENGNEGTHFHPIRDSWRIYKVILGGFLRYSAASIISWLIDYGILTLLMLLVFGSRDKDVIPILGIGFEFRALVAAPIARLCSAPVNFLLNRNFVFRSGRGATSVWRYIVLSLACMVITTLVFAFLNQYVPRGFLEILLKIVIDVLMYFANFRIQQNWVFAAERKGTEQ